MKNNGRLRVNLFRDARGNTIFTSKKCHRRYLCTLYADVCKLECRRGGGVSNEEDTEWKFYAKIIEKWNKKKALQYIDSTNPTKVQWNWEKKEKLQKHRKRVTLYIEVGINQGSGNSKKSEFFLLLYYSGGTRAPKSHKSFATYLRKNLRKTKAKYVSKKYEKSRERHTQRQRESL